MPFNPLILCRPRLLLPSIFPSIRVFSNKSALHMRWLKYWSFSFNIGPSNEHPGLISFRIDWFVDHNFPLRSKRVLISWLQSLSAVILEPRKIKSDTISTVSPSISHEVMGPDAMIFVFWMLSFNGSIIWGDYCENMPGWEGPLEEGMATHSSVPAWRIPWTEEPGGPWGCRVRHDWVTNTFKLPLIISLENFKKHFVLWIQHIK